jgi:6-pyruvoyl-tetrahydropterin synthase
MVFVYVTAQFEALHRWADVPLELDFLSHPHRHIFKVRLTVMPPHDEDLNSRAVEFITLKSELEHFLAMSYSECHPIHGRGCMNESCESMATTIFNHFQEQGYDVHSVSVSEDGENGAIVTDDSNS